MCIKKEHKNHKSEKLWETIRKRGLSVVTWIISLYSAFLNSNAVNLGKTGHGLIIKRCIWKERKTTKNLHNIKLKEKCGHRHKQNAIHIQWKIEGSLNARVNEGIIRMNSRRFNGFSSPSLLGQQKSCISLSPAIALFITLLNPQNKQQTTQVLLTPDIVLLLWRFHL